jgi:hypothetical protein
MTQASILRSTMVPVLERAPTSTIFDNRSSRRERSYEQEHANRKREK